MASSEEMVTFEINVSTNRIGSDVSATFEVPLSELVNHWPEDWLDVAWELHGKDAVWDLIDVSIKQV